MSGTKRNARTNEFGGRKALRDQAAALENAAARLRAEGKLSLADEWEAKAREVRRRINERYGR